MAYSEYLDEAFGPDDDREFLGCHLGCGGNVYPKTYRGARDGPGGPPLEPDETQLLCNRCGEELSDEEITRDGDGFPCPECHEYSAHYPDLCDECKAKEVEA